MSSKQAFSVEALDPDQQAGGHLEQVAAQELVAALGHAGAVVDLIRCGVAEGSSSRVRRICPHWKRCWSNPGRSMTRMETQSRNLRPLP